MSLHISLNKSGLTVTIVSVVTCFLIALIGMHLYSTRDASAISGADFNAGRIIDDAVFYNSGAMSSSQIQAFLNSKVPTCDTQGTGPSGYGNTRAEYAASMGWHGPPYTCLRDYSQNTPQMEAASGLCESLPAKSNSSSAQIIYDVAVACGINPQVFVVLLEKEQSLITDVWPLDIQLKNATGFACPDTAPCDPNFAGFFYQVYYAARQFKVYKANPNNYNYRAGRTNTIYWHPDLSRCGSSQVYIENQATAALYIYTPYRPNQAALNNLRGTGDNCSSYGNRNFWRLFTDWFGSTLGIPQSNLYISNGMYSVINQVSRRGVDVTGGQTSNGTAIQIYNPNNTAAQKWYFERDSEGYYSLKNVASGRYLDVTNGSRLPGAGVQIWDGNSTCAQKWALVTSGDKLHILNKCSGLSLDAIGGQLTNGTKLQIWNKNTSGAQLWKLISHDPASANNGFYEISTNSGLSLEISGGSTVNGTQLQLWNSNKSPSQYWQITRQADGLYTIRNPASGRYMDVVNASTAAGAGIHIFDGGPTCAQRWVISGTGSSGLTIRSSCSDKALDVVNADITTPGAKIQTWDSNGTAAQKWYLTKQPINPPDGLYSLSTNSGLSLEISGGSTVNGTQLQLWNSNKSPSQYWQITRQADGLYTIRNPASGRYMDVTGGKVASSTPIHIWDSNKFCAQKWSIQDNNNGTFTILSACSNSFALDVTSGSTSTPGTKIQLYSKNGSSAQSWIIGTP